MIFHITEQSRNPASTDSDDNLRMFFLVQPTCLNASIPVSCFAIPSRICAVHAWHPSLARLDNGELLSAFDLGQGAESLDYRTYLSRSRDDGRTWSAPVPLFEDSSERRSTHSIRISNTTDGDLVGFGGRFYRDDPTVGLVNHTNLGYVPMDLLFLRSADDGRHVECKHSSTAVDRARVRNMSLDYCTQRWPLACPHIDMARVEWRTAKRNAGDRTRFA